MGCKRIVTYVKIIHIVIKHKKQGSVTSLIIYLSVLVFLIILFIYSFPAEVEKIKVTIKNTGSQLASVIVHNFRSIAEIKKSYSSSKDKVNILIVPGHEPNFGGAEFSNLKEREMNVELGEYLTEFLLQDSNYKVFVTRDNNYWTMDFNNYFNKNWDDIVKWTESSKEEFLSLVSMGSTTQTFSKVFHNDAPPDVALRLYGINKWSNENEMDIAIHIHFNDNRRKDTSVPGKYSGFSIYVPSSQYGNSDTTKTIASSLFNRLSKYNSVSNLPGEIDGIIDEPELIAVGSNNTADAASVLIEYGYIYEPQFKDSESRSKAIKDLAYQTYLGLHDFFNPDNTLVYNK